MEAGRGQGQAGGQGAGGTRGGRGRGHIVSGGREGFKVLRVKLDIVAIPRSNLKFLSNKHGH